MHRSRCVRVLDTGVRPLRRPPGPVRHPLKPSVPPARGPLQDVSDGPGRGTPLPTTCVYKKTPKAGPPARSCRTGRRPGWPPRDRVSAGTTAAAPAATAAVGPDPPVLCSPGSLLHPMEDGHAIATTGSSPTAPTAGPPPQDRVRSRQPPQTRYTNTLLSPAPKPSRRRARRVRASSSRTSQETMTSCSLPPPSLGRAGPEARTPLPPAPGPGLEPSAGSLTTEDDRSRRPVGLCVYQVIPWTWHLSRPRDPPDPASDPSPRDHYGIQDPPPL